MEGQQTTVALQGLLDELACVRGDAPAEPVVRVLLGRAAERIESLCSSFLLRHYPRLMRPPLNLRSQEMLSAVVERLMRALREARPGSVRQFFAIANQHIRWELNDLARRLDQSPPVQSLPDDVAVSADPSSSQLSPDAQRLFAAIDGLPSEEREAFELIRVQGLTRNEAAAVLGVSPKTAQRRLHRALLLLSAAVGDLRPSASAPRPAPLAYE